MNDHPLLQHFSYAHLPEFLQPVSKDFYDLAVTILQTHADNAERDMALRKLLEAKDCTVRSFIFTNTMASNS